MIVTVIDGDLCKKGVYHPKSNILVCPFCMKSFINILLITEVWKRKSIVKFKKKMMAKPINTIELHYPMIQFLKMSDIS